MCDMGPPPCLRLDIANGSVLTQCQRRHRRQESASFLRHVEASVPAKLEVHLICDNYTTHKHPRVRTWLARRPRFHLHFTPTYSAWLNQVERWCALITHQAIRRGSVRFGQRPQAPDHHLGRPLQAASQAIHVDRYR
jgi:hypothetical protein